MRLGGDRILPVDARIIAAASRDPDLSVYDGKFGPDLFFRPNVLQFQIPALGERLEDIPLLLDFLIRMFSKHHNLESVSFLPIICSFWVTMPGPAMVAD